MPEWEVGDTLVHRVDGTRRRITRITSAGAMGTSHPDGPTYHARAIRPDGTLSEVTVDIWSKSISYPTRAFELVPEERLKCLGCGNATLDTYACPNSDTHPGVQEGEWKVRAYCLDCCGCPDHTADESTVKP